MTATESTVSSRKSDAPLAQTGLFFKDIKIAHTIFALPFALMATLLAGTSADASFPSFFQVGLILVAMFGARTWAMAVNRLADEKIDKANPRTANRGIPSGMLNRKSVQLFAVLSALVFVAAAAGLSGLALACSVPVLLILASYSFTKRFTWLCHFWLGACLGLAPLGAWVALNSSIEPSVLLLSGAVMFWVGGFDVMYALQDLGYDKETNLNSVPARFGRAMALKISMYSHIVASALFVAFGFAFNLGTLYFAGTVISMGLLFWQHLLIAKKGDGQIPFAFFNLNGWIAVILFVATFADHITRTFGSSQ